MQILVLKSFLKDSGQFKMAHCSALVFLLFCNCFMDGNLDQKLVETIIVMHEEIDGSEASKTNYSFEFTNKYIITFVFGFEIPLYLDCSIFMFSFLYW